jgi:hypothetical protein
VGRASRLKREKRKLLELIAEAQSAHPIQTDRTGIWRRIPPIGKVLIGVAVPLFGLWIGYVQTVKPRILISEPGTFFEPADPFSSPFYIINQGYFSIYSVSAVCENERDVFADTNTQAYGNRVIHDIEIPEIAATGRAPWKCATGIFLKSPLQEAHLRVDVSFRPAILSWIHHAHQEFDAFHNSEGKWFWFPRVDVKAK